MMHRRAVNVVYVVAGIAAVAWILNDIFKQVLVPRAVEGTLRISVQFARLMWRIGRFVIRFTPEARREDLLGGFAPLYFILLLGVWLTALIFAYGLILFGLRDEIRPPLIDFGAALYFSASSLLTIGFGDIVATQGLARLVAVFAGASGIGTVAVAITFLYAIIGAFQQRERFVVVLDARAGAPPSGVALLETYAALGILDELPALFRDSESWVADVLDSHLAYPILMSFRSSHKDESWVAALGALLDAAALLVTVIQSDGARAARINGAARLFLDVGMHLTHDLGAYFELPGDAPLPTNAEQQRMIRERFESVGIGVHDDPALWNQFNILRTAYAQPLTGIGRRWLHTTSQLIGERTALPGHAS